MNIIRLTFILAFLIALTNFTWKNGWSGTVFEMSLIALGALTALAAYEVVDLALQFLQRNTWHAARKLLRDNGIECSIFITPSELDEEQRRVLVVAYSQGYVPFVIRQGKTEIVGKLMPIAQIRELPDNVVEFRTYATHDRRSKS